MPKPWPLNPVAMNRPFSAASSPRVGTASGVTSIMPAQASTSATPFSAGKRFGRRSSMRAMTSGDGDGLSTRMRSNGLTASALQRRAMPQAPG